MPRLADLGEGVVCGVGLHVGNVWVEDDPSDDQVTVEGSDDGKLLSADSSSPVLLDVDVDGSRVMEVE